MLTSKHLVAARGLIGWTQQRLADESAVGIDTVRRLESKPDAIGNAAVRTVAALQGVLEKAGIEFLNDGQPGVRLKSRATMEVDRHGARGRRRRNDV